MIKIINLNQTAPYLLFRKKYDAAYKARQKNIEAIVISSYNKQTSEVDSRYVNIKMIDDNQFIFFTNYQSPKSLAFSSHNQITGLFFWSSINVQIRIKAKIKKTSKKFNENYFKNRSREKNAVAISSRQSKEISSYKKVVENYRKAYEEKHLSLCPEYWGGFSFIPYYFEFWEGHDSRINKRIVFKEFQNKWEKTIIQP